MTRYEPIKSNNEVFPPMILRSIVIQYFFSHHDFSKGNKEKHRPFGWPESWWNYVWFSVVDKHANMGNHFRYYCPRWKGGWPILEVEDVVAIFILIDYLSLTHQPSWVDGHYLAFFYVSRCDNTSSLSRHSFDDSREDIRWPKLLQYLKTLVLQVGNVWLLELDAVGQAPQINSCHCCHVEFQVLHLEPHIHSTCFWGGYSGQINMPGVILCIRDRLFKHSRSKFGTVSVVGLAKADIGYFAATVIMISRQALLARRCWKSQGIQAHWTIIEPCKMLSSMKNLPLLWITPSRNIGCEYNTLINRYFMVTLILILGEE